MAMILVRRPAVSGLWQAVGRAPRRPRAAPDRPAGIGRTRPARRSGPQRGARHPPRADARRGGPRGAAAPALAGASEGPAAAYGRAAPRIRGRAPAARLAHSLRWVLRRSHFALVGRWGRGLCGARAVAEYA